MKTNHKLKTILFAAIALIGSISFLPQQANAQDVKVSMQGVLKNFDGTIVDNGNYNIVVNLYDVTAGGTSLWSENQNISTVGGVFNSYLGATPAGLAALQLLTFNVPYYVGITIVGDQEMSPRIELTGMPYAIRANTANFANGVVLPGNPTVSSDPVTGDLELGGGGTGDVVITQGKLIADSVSFNTLAVNVVNDANLVGTVIAFFGTPANVPAGYLLCDGASLSRSTYARLFNVIGTANGTADVLSFNVPDLRGMFLRGVDGATANDPDAGARTAANAGGNTGDNVGSAQSDTIDAHQHLTNINTPGNGGGGAFGSSIGVSTHYVMWGSNEGVTYAAKTSSIGGSETRPKNVYCYYIIKY